MGKPPSFASHVESDFRLKKDRDAVAQELKQHPPELLILCPPCTDEGGWFNLNAAYLDSMELTRRIAQSRLYIRFCAQLFEQQLKAGKQAPPGASTRFQAVELSGNERADSALSPLEVSYAPLRPSTSWF